MTFELFPPVNPAHERGEHGGSVVMPCERGLLHFTERADAGDAETGGEFRVLVRRGADSARAEMGVEWRERVGEVGGEWLDEQHAVERR